MTENIKKQKLKSVVWNQLNWKVIERKVFRLQKRIYRAKQRGDVRTWSSLQRLLLKSWYAKLLAVRRVTQDNQGSAARWRAEEKSESVTPAHCRSKGKGGNTRNRDNLVSVKVKVLPLKCPGDSITPSHGEGSAARTEAGWEPDQLSARTVVKPGASGAEQRKRTLEQTVVIVNLRNKANTQGAK